ncbi:hypothetical protein [Actinokineospora iranica]|nr:hypothetical protein [Actinokineospora iranica]
MLAKATATGMVVLAREALLLWPRESDRDSHADLWPVFTVVLDDDDLARTTCGGMFTSWVERDHRAVVLLDGVCRWSVLAEDEPLLGLLIEATAPVPAALSVVLPARSLRSELRRLACGPTVGITTARVARSLSPGVDTRRALRSMVLARSAPAPRLAALAEELAS